VLVKRSAERVRTGSSRHGVWRFRFSAAGTFPKARRFTEADGLQLGKIAQILLQCLRGTEDLLARYGGEEFIRVLPGADADVALNRREAMRMSIEASTFGMTVSVGTRTQISKAVGSYDALIGGADQVLYAAKHGGRNQVQSRVGMRTGYD